MEVRIQLQLKELELSSLSETIKAINSNASENHLYRIYRFTMHSYQSLSKMALFVLNETTECKAVFGTKNQYEKLKMADYFPHLEELSKRTDLTQTTYFNEFDFILPIRHKNQLLAVVFLGKSPSLTDEILFDIDFFETLTNIIIVAIENKKFARKAQKQEDLRKQLEIAKQVQTLLFPKQLPYNEKLKVNASYQPHHSVGGDYYDYIPITDDRFMICIADVSGKGVPAAILMSNFQAGLRVSVRHGTPLKKIIQNLNQLILENSGGANFITAFLAEYDFSTQKLTYVNAGHNPPFLYHPDGKIEELNDGTVMLGAFPKLPFLDSKTIEIQDFFLFCFTDGFIETYDETGEEFGEEQLRSFVQVNIREDQETLHQKLIETLHHFKGKNAYIDDITLLSCQVGDFGKVTNTKSPTEVELLF